MWASVILFPSPSSIPIDAPAVASKISRLLVFDCKWTKSISLQSPQFRSLTHVKLSNPPAESRYWRWHNGDPGFLCTVEATVVALYEATKNPDWVKGLYLFGLQRAAIKQNCDENDLGYPWDVTYKNEKRSQTKQEGSERQKKQRLDSRQMPKEERQLAGASNKSEAGSLEGNSNLAADLQGAGIELIDFFSV